MDSLRAPSFMIGAALAFASVGAAVKIAATTLPNESVVFFRNVLGLVALVPLLLGRQRPTLSTPVFHLHVLRAGTGLTAMYCFFYAVAHLDLATAVLLNYSSPLFIPLIARLWLGEPIPSNAPLPILVGFVGILFILKPGSGMLSTDAIVGVAAGLFAGCAFVSVRRLAAEPTLRTVFWFGVLATAASTPLQLTVGRLPATHEVLLLALLGAFATAGQLLLTKAYSLAPAARLAPYVYATVVFAAGFGWIGWNEIPDGLAVIGALLVVAAAAFASRQLQPSVIAPVGPTGPGPAG